MNENITNNSNVPWGNFKGGLPQMVSLYSKATARIVDLSFLGLLVALHLKHLCTFVFLPVFCSCFVNI